MTPNNTSGVRRRNLTHKQNRKDLLSNQKTKEKKSKSSGSKSAQAHTSATAAQEAQDLTSSLRRTKSMMQQELNRISNVSETIDNDGSMLERTKEDHFGMKGGIQGAKGSVARLKLQEKEDSIVFWASVLFFYSVVLYVLWTRIRIPFIMW